MNGFLEINQVNFQDNQLNILSNRLKSQQPSQYHPNTFVLYKIDNFHIYYKYNLDHLLDIVRMYMMDIEKTYHLDQLQPN